MNKDIQPQIDQFWEWFEKHEDKFRKVTDPVAAREMLDNQILQFGLFAWEIGEGYEKPFYLLISPNGNSDRLHISKQLVDSAMEFKHWEFFASKPPIDWDFVFEMYDQNSVLHELDASDWEYSLHLQWDNSYNILVDPSGMDAFDHEIKIHAAELVVTNLLGEEMKILHIGEVKVFSELGDADEGDWYDMEELYEHVEDLVG